MKQAVVLIHGVGEQVPMDTLRGFVDTVWKTDPSAPKAGRPNTVWSKPDKISDNFELRRLTTVENKRGQRTDFFEFYWADLMTDTTLSQVWAWLRVLLLRSPTRIPRQLLGLWSALVLLTVAAGIYWTHHYLRWPNFTLPAEIVKGAKVVGPILWIGISWFLIYYAGDAARYLHVAPSNIQNRRKIRETGVKLLQSLHDCGSYDQIILVGHSLGTVIGYDILTELWAKYNERYDAAQVDGPSPQREALEKLASLPPGFDADAYQARQRLYRDELRARGNPWLVSHFITMGSPLAHAAVLMAQNADRLNDKIVQREYPGCPPMLEGHDANRRFTFEMSNGVTVPHHAAVFGPTRWTNLYFPCHWTLWGDFIGGPVAPAFGEGVKDVPVQTTQRAGIFSHTLYWTRPDNFDPAHPPTHIKALRDALQI